MKLLLLISIIIFPAIMFYFTRKTQKACTIFNCLAILSSIIFGYIAATSIVQVIIDDVVFMTTIHKVFLNPLFLITGAYLGVYIIYRLLIITVQGNEHSKHQ